LLKNLKLTKPIAFIDVETTGLHPNTDRIVELSILKVLPDGNTEYKSHRVNPGVPIPVESIAIHGITDSDVANEPEFGKYAKSVKDFLDGCDISGFNVISFDLPFLEAEFARVEVNFSRQGRALIDSQVIYHKMEPRNLQSAYQKYCGKQMVVMHNSQEDAKVAAEILDGQLEAHPELPRDVATLCSYCYQIEENCIDPEGKFVWVEGKPVCNFGRKHKGRRLEEIAQQDPSYLLWISTADFSLQVRTIAENALKGQFPSSRTS
jgi:DNA polymerase-3 subunit epsilon